MRTAHLSFGHQMLGMVSGGNPQMSKFEQISSDGHQMSLAGGHMYDVQGDGVDPFLMV